MTGKSDFEKAQVDMIVDCAEEYVWLLIDVFHYEIWNQPVIYICYHETKISMVSKISHILWLRLFRLSLIYAKNHKLG